MSTSFNLPEVIKDFYYAVNNYDGTMLLDCFTEDAAMYDEGKELHGPVEISEHIIKANKDVNAVTDITNYKDESGIIVVTVTLRGEFDGSPVSLDFRFTLEGGKIRGLDVI